MTAAAPATGQDTRRWVQVDAWLRHHEGAAETRTAREQALAALPTTYERRLAVARRERAER